MHLIFRGQASFWGRTMTAKTFRIMRMTAAFLLIAGLHASAGIRAQKITLTVRQAPLRTVFKEISRQTGLSVMYDEDMLLQSSPVSLSVKNASLEETLQACLKDQPFMYSLIN